MKPLLLATSAALVAMAVPAVAAEEQATTPQDDIECAAWASYTGSYAEDDVADNSMAMAFNYFLGRYQAIMGDDFGDALADAINAMDADDSVYDRYNAVCQPRWLAHGQALLDWSASVSGTTVEDGSAS
ncbi:hypothetical protein SZ64_06695 [Erythrobacter sp. SG61-1L]|uniref:hypothetical protein n=1 Tax=Erythrobacter sp. SG61-1L TaxID=1603897 RepID=UPI0006C8EF4B|nr:hypothetical protein [Erythrobacter sp. SG61-1L]KPL67826.1 hypothetical protein SZ64_06695 [Erythrobacter sp. SG61-1L]